MTLAEFARKLDAHDWHYSFSDDSRVFAAGEKSLGELRRIAMESPQHHALFLNRRARAWDKTIPLMEVPQ